MTGMQTILHSAKLTRRSLVLAAASLAVAGGGALASAPAVAAERVSLDAFLRASSFLTGVSDLDAEMGGAILAGLLAAGHADALEALVRDPAGQASGDVAGEVTAAWFSGVFTDADGETVADIQGALLWGALTFTKPWTICGGETGYWSEPPAS